jgi:hypothetical protein
MASEARDSQSYSGESGQTPEAAQAFEDPRADGGEDRYVSRQAGHSYREEKGARVPGIASG